MTPVPDTDREEWLDVHPRADLPPHRRSRVPVLVAIVAAAVLGYLIAWPLTGGAL